ncbi:small subunit ribosomal protein S24e [Angomonas deanei]|uniref:40S ribosomal protein S24 n=1 Tax=Angomonas deanei TaxID=59799 RepID=S9V9R2_9TRYP|nr:small subunit ribosomal protein S24e [Angomonas deanei]EPY35849.1 small subunit ribosomal protein S24e [Angomonas deanei]EPY37558.1 small subunit ribosomal protein S24e [Angomonas deanei]EPY37687.1 small subunit ribosomal protein S24e [Angomonas deanei]CAD2214457.1 Ribosomal protein S24e, putative [Angomonas deanei]|eukprot:EPY34042.1 small subunit ribosomal protein S24e [Angomonas deanei]
MGFQKKKAEISIRTSQFKVNKLLNRRQFIVEVTHPNWCGTVPSKTIQAKIAALYKVPDANQVSVFGFKTKFGGGKTTGFGLIYDDIASLKRIEPKYRKVRMGVGKGKLPARKSVKERRNRNKKLRGCAKGKSQGSKKK